MTFAVFRLHHPILTAVLLAIRSRGAALAASAGVVVVSVSAGTMTPAWMLAVMWAVNISISVAYTVIPNYLVRETRNPEMMTEEQAHESVLGVYIGPAVVGDFAAFIRACGDHHEWSHAAMMLMMAGAMQQTTAAGGSTGTAMLWAGFLLALFFDLRTAYVSFNAADSFRIAKGLT